jgi:broad specificity phosphatase PhoE
MNRFLLVAAAALVLPPMVLPGCTRPTSDRVALAVSCVPPTTLLLVRHAERLDESEDAPLSEPGRRRAEALREALRDAGVDRIVVSAFRRTRETAAPLADRLGLDVTVDSAVARMEDARSLVLRLRNEYPGETILVVGHSDTVPAMLGAITGDEPAELDGYGDLFVVSIVDAADPPSLLRLRVGT